MHLHTQNLHDRSCQCPGQARRTSPSLRLTVHWHALEYRCARNHLVIVAGPARLRRAGQRLARFLSCCLTVLATYAWFADILHQLWRLGFLSPAWFTLLPVLSNPVSNTRKWLTEALEVIPIACHSRDIQRLYTIHLNGHSRSALMYVPASF
ncbi:hypothetical protein EI94DRAFT_1749039 [Lactarius quietus]|nr:hypothetical protein EI94DRAFT_1749039 [Lactarius quietus]